MQSEIKTQLSVYDSLYNQTSNNSNKLYTFFLLYGRISVYVVQYLSSAFLKSADFNTFLEQTIHINIISFAICFLILGYVFSVTSEKFVTTLSKYHISNDSVLELDLNDLKKVNKKMYELNMSQKASIYCMLRLILLFLLNVSIIISGIGSSFAFSGKESIFKSFIFTINIIMLFAVFLTLITYWMLLNQDKLDWMKLIKRDAQEKMKWRKIWKIGLFGEASIMWVCVLFSFPFIVTEITPIIPHIIGGSIIVILFLLWTLA